MSLKTFPSCPNTGLGSDIAQWKSIFFVHGQSQGAPSCWGHGAFSFQPMLYPWFNTGCSISVVNPCCWWLRIALDTVVVDFLWAVNYVCVPYLINWMLVSYNHNYTLVLVSGCLKNPNRKWYIDNHIMGCSVTIIILFFLFVSSMLVWAHISATWDACPELD